MRNRRLREEEAENHERWLVSYADFITLMFAFFTVLYATSERNMEKTKQFQESVKQFLVKAGAFGGSGDKINQGEKYNSPIEPPIQTFAQSPAGAQEVQTKVTTLLESQMSQEQIDRIILDISSDEYGARIVLAAEEIFEKETSRLRVDAVPVVNLIGEMLLSLGNKVIVEGHSQTGSAESARELSSDRSNRLIQFFLRNDPDKVDRFIAMSFGNQRPLQNEDAQRASRFNERIELRVLSDDTPF